MFTGLIREIGTLRRLVPGRESTRLDIRAPRTAGDLAAGDSLAVDGICLTVTGTRGEVVTVQAAVETRRVTTLRRWRIGRRVHLEPALRAGQALDGHLVLGHVDGTGRIARVARRGDSLLMTVRCGGRLAAWLMPKGSVAVDGVSLTVDEGPHTDRFTVNLIPYTLQWTRFAQARTGDEVNLEMDVLVKAARTGRTAEAFGALGGADDRAASDGKDRSIPSLAYILDRGFGRKGRS
ncbi:riboflavin synthase [bacterium]|nr:riboflavin synthase [bacterium]